MTQPPEPRRRRLPRAWLLWVTLTLASTGVLAALLTSQAPQRTVFLPGTTTHGHHQIEVACGACHTDAFGGGEVLQAACTGCHAQELETANDSHPRSKFTDPRNADRVAILDARECITCHREHQPDLTRPMGLTLPLDYCYRCHQDIEEKRPTHVDLGFETCASAGCHNYHDNRALYEDFLVAHAGEPEHLPSRQLPASNATRLLNPDLADAAALGLLSQDGGGHGTDEIHASWAASAHAAGGVNCSGCHGTAAQWVEAPDHTACADCHALEVDGFLLGRHGMRLAQELPPMQVADARVDMHADASHRELGCSSCHAAHDYSRTYAAAEACVNCHASNHTRAWAASPHGRAWRDELDGSARPGSGASCASCHLPVVSARRPGVAEVRYVQHNQNDTLRPNEKMIRPVCGNCHGIGFAIDALADPRLVETNYAGAPVRHVESIEMAVSRGR